MQVDKFLKEKYNVKDTYASVTLKKIDDGYSLEYVSSLMNHYAKKQMLDFINWYRQDDLSNYEPKHLVDWFLKIDSKL